MAKRLQLRRGTTTEHASFTGEIGEVTVDTDKDTVVVHDGSTVGGFPLVRVGGSENVGIGTTAPASNKLYVQSSQDGGYAAVIENTDADNGYGLLIKSSDDDNVRPLTIRDKDDTDLFLLYGAGKTYMKGNVGIGDDDPDERLVVSNDASTSYIKMDVSTASYPKLTLLDASIELDDTTTPTLPLNIKARNPGNGAYTSPITFWTGAGGGSLTQKMIIAGNGYVGIGTDDPSTLLQAFYNHTGDTTGVKGISVKNNSRNQLLKIHSDTNSASIIQSADGNNTINYNGGTAHTDYNLALNPYGGNVGIGTTGPIASLDIYNMTSGTATTDYDIALRDNGSVSNFHKIGFGYATTSTMPAYIGYDCMDAAAYSKGDLIFGTRNSTGNDAPDERMRITSSGNVAINGSSTVSTSGALIVSDHDLLVPHDAQDKITYSMESDQCWIGMYAPNASNCGFRIVEDGTVDWYIYNSGGTFRFGSDSNSDGVTMAQGANGWSAITSDERKKTDWVVFNDALNKINTLTKIGLYKRIDPISGEYLNEDQVLTGLSAQEIEKILPDSIIKQRQPIDFFPDDDTEYLTFPYQDVFVLAIKAIQELSTKVTALENA